MLHPAQGALQALLKAVDRDGDKRITQLDGEALAFDLPLRDGGSYRIAGVYRLANTVQELKLQQSKNAQHPGETSALEISLARINENPVDRLSRHIRERYWQGLTRQIEGAALARVLDDEKISASPNSLAENTNLLTGCTSPQVTEEPPRFLYVPHADAAAFDYYEQQTSTYPWLVVCQLPQQVTPEWVRGLSGYDTGLNRHGLLGLGLRDGTPIPYVVPGGRFNELYGWDSYFHVLGLVVDEQLQRAIDIVDNFAYELEHYGQILNANRSYYLTRSQPPFFSSMVRAVWQASAKTGKLQAAWRRRMLQLMEQEHRQVWLGQARTTNTCQADVCLARYFGSGIGQPPEVEPDHFAWLYQQHAQKTGLSAEVYQKRYLERRLPADELEALDTFFSHDRCMRESGHDTTYRWFDARAAEDRCADYATVDLNSLLLRYELDLAAMYSSDGAPEAHNKQQHYCALAHTRLSLMREKMWDPKRHLFFDFNTSTNTRSQYISATSIYPLWAIEPDNVCELKLFESATELGSFTHAFIQALEQAGGLASTAKDPAEHAQQRLSAQLGQSFESLQRQWDYPNGWAPHQILAWTALRNHGLSSEANRLIWRWLSMIVQNARAFHGTVPEKFDVVRRSHQVFAEYGNVGTDFAYITDEGFGWMNASFQIGLSSMPEGLRARLRAAAERPEEMPAVP